MNDLHAITVFHVKDAEESLKFYTKTLGFELDWNYAPDGSAFVFQVNLLGFRLIVNEVEDLTKDRAGRGRVFLGLEDDQLLAFRKHVETKGIVFEVVFWGEPTLLIRDPDENWISVWLPPAERADLKVGQAWP